MFRYIRIHEYYKPTQFAVSFHRQVVRGSDPTGLRSVTWPKTYCQRFNSRSWFNGGTGRGSAVMQVVMVVMMMMMMMMMDDQVVRAAQIFHDIPICFKSSEVQETLPAEVLHKLNATMSASESRYSGAVVTCLKLGRKLDIWDHKGTIP